MSSTREARLRELHGELLRLKDTIQETGEDRLRRFEERYDGLRELLAKAGTKELPHKQAIRTAAKARAAEIHRDLEQGALGEQDVSRFDPVFAKLKYADVDGAKEALKELEPRARTLQRYDQKRETYRKLHRKERSSVRELEEELSDRIRLSHRLQDMGDPDEVANRLQKYESAVKRHNDQVASAVKQYLERDASEVVSLVLHADYLPLTNPPVPAERGAAKQLSDVEGFTVYELLTFDRLSTGKQQHLVDDPERMRTLLNGNLAWLRDLSDLHGTRFAKMRVEDPAMALERGREVRRILRRMECPLEPLEMVEEAARETDSEVMELVELSNETGAEPDELEEVLDREIKELERRIDEKETMLNDLTAPDSFSAF